MLKRFINFNFEKAKAITILFVVIFGSLFSTFSAKELFPFSHYPMYSSVFQPDPFYSYVVLEGIRQNGESLELNVWEYFWPLYERSLIESLDLTNPWPQINQLRKNSELTSEDVFRSQINRLNDLLALYNYRKENWPSAKKWPEINGFRVYNRYWNWNSLIQKSRAQKIKNMKDFADGQDLLIEVP